MTDIKSAIEQIQIEMIKDIDIPKSAKTELANQKALHLAIRSLNAWEEVIAQLKVRRDYYEKKNYTLFVEVNACINIIESLLEEVKE